MDKFDFTRATAVVTGAASASAAEEAAGKASFAQLLTYPPERAAGQIVAAVENRRPRLLEPVHVLRDLPAHDVPGGQADADADERHLRQAQEVSRLALHAKTPDIFERMSGVFLRGR
jgi:hypothetical protein